IPPGMPRLMNLYAPMEILITPETTYLLIEYIRDSRRIYTDGRDWPEDFDPTFAGYSIGQWLAEARDGNYDGLRGATRFLKGPRALDATGLPLHSDNKTIVKERIFPDKADRNKLYEITTVDNAFTRPWTITKTYLRADAATALARGGLRREQRAR